MTATLSPMAPALPSMSPARSRPAGFRRLSPSRLATLTNEQLATLVVNQHPQAREIEAHLVHRNEKLVHSIVRRYASWCSLPAEDLHAEGMKGFLIGIRKYDPSKGTKLSTLVVHWIRQSVGRAAEASEMVRIPTHMADDLSRYHNQKAEVEGLSAEQIAKHFGWKAQHTEMVLQAYDVRYVVSLDAPVTGDAKASTFGELLPSFHTGPEEHVMQGALSLQLETVLRKLAERTQAVLRRCVLGEETLDAAGRELGLSRERVRQIRERGLRTLRQEAALRNIER